MRKVKVLLYFLYLGVVVILGLEVCLRFGLVESEAYRNDALLAGMGEGRRVLILGDSFSLESEGSFADLLREHLAAKGIVTLNLARSGSGPQAYLEMFRRYGQRFQPDLVIVNFFAGNDTSDTLYNIDRYEGYEQETKRLISKSYVGSLLLEMRARMITRRRLAAIEAYRKEDSEPSIGDVPNPFFLELSLHHPDYFQTNLLLDSRGARRSWEANEESLLAISTMAAAASSAVLMNILPSTVQVNESHYAFFEGLGFTLDPEFLSSNLPQDLLMQFCERNRIPCLDLLPHFREHRDQEFYEPNDNHWNDKGDRFAFDLVRQEVEELLARGPAGRP